MTAADVTAPMAIATSTVATSIFIFQFLSSILFFMGVSE